MTDQPFEHRYSLILSQFRGDNPTVVSYLFIYILIFFMSFYFDFRIIYFIILKSDFESKNR